jgi:DtxR family Mn-dependent transcriptional regulator
MTQSLEDYLETIGNLAVIDNNPRVKDIAQVLGLSKPSVHIALHTLEKEGMIEHEHYGAITLTEKGRCEYEKIKHKHDTLRIFFEHVLGVSSENADKDACAMEHIISPEAFDKIEELVVKHKKN